jgi:hypothetical protein
VRCLKKQISFTRPDIAIRLNFVYVISCSSWEFVYSFTADARANLSCNYSALAVSASLFVYQLTEHYKLPFFQESDENFAIFRETLGELLFLSCGLWEFASL